MLTGVFEPIFYLLALGIGLGGYIGDVDSGGGEIPYAAYIAPALLAVSAMNGAIYDSTWNVFFKMHFGKLYQGMLATSLGPLDVALGEISLALLRGAAYGTTFLLVMQALGLNLAFSAVLALPAILVIAFGFASLGMGITSYLKSFQQMEWIQFVLLPMFLFSATFYPLSVYPQPIQWLVQALPALARGRTRARPDHGRARAGHAHPPAVLRGDDRRGACVHDAAAAGALPRLTRGCCCSRNRANRMLTRVTTSPS